MAKKKKNQEQVFKVYPNIYTELDWPIGWENESPEDLTGHIVDFVYEKQFTENDPIPVPKDIVLHQTLGHFKGEADTLRAFLFLDTADTGLIKWGDDIETISHIKGRLVVVRGYKYTFGPSVSLKRRVLEIIF